MEIAIVDDTAADRDRLSALLDSIFARKGFPAADITCFDSGEALLSQPWLHQFDLIFLDIYMKKMTGIETAQQIRRKDRRAKLIFTTVSNDFACESYVVQANYYLLKPCDEQKLSDALESVGLFSPPEQAPSITLPNGHTIKLASIAHTSFSGHYVAIHQTFGNTISVRCTQKEFENLILSYPDFVLCTKGIIANLGQVATLEDNRFLMKDGVYLPISRRNYNIVRAAYYDYMFRNIRNGVIF